VPDEVIEPLVPADIVEVVTAEYLADTTQALEIAEVSEPEIFIETDLQLQVVDAPESSVLLEMAVQGPIGPPGPVGPPGPPNTTPISAAPGNTLTLGPDNGLFVQQVWSGTPAW
jgi:hypothetical protein